jgi:amino acid transporter
MGALHWSMHMWTRLRSWFVGPPLPSTDLEARRLSKFQALAAFSPDALSSIAYANQEIYLALLVAGAAGLSAAWPVGLAIGLLLTLVAISYLQTIHAYPSGGGSYAVTRANLGRIPGLVTAAALLTGYLLTAAVSLTAAVEAIASAFPALWLYRVQLALLLLGGIALANLRGLRESGTLMAVPVYGFVMVYLMMLLYGLVRLVIEGPSPLSAVAPPATQTLTGGLVLRAFASGCTALSGIEAISNGVPAFQPPEARNAGRTLLIMALLMGLLFVGSIGLTQGMAVVAAPEETILSALARHVVGRGVVHWAIQIITMAILAVAANTSFAGFPTLAAILAEAGFMPRQLRTRGERLVFSNGILVLTLAAAALIMLFHGDTHALMPLFAVGVFAAFTLSQAGMVVHWWRRRGSWWYLKALLNGVGALATGATALIVGVNKFASGAWIILTLIPLLVIIFLKIRRHYDDVAEQLVIGADLPCPLVPGTRRIVIPIATMHRGIFEAVAYASSLTADVTAVYVEIEPGSAERVRVAWQRCWPHVPLDIVPSPYRTLLRPLFDYLDELDARADDGQLATVMLPEVVPARWWQGLLHNQSAFLIRAALLYRRRMLGFQRTIIDVPYHLQR